MYRHAQTDSPRGSSSSLAAARNGRSGCKKKQEATTSAIQNIGSDTMVNLAQAWAEEYAKIAPERLGRGLGRRLGRRRRRAHQRHRRHRQLAAASSSPRKSRRRARTARTPEEFMVGYDGLAIYVHKDNPLDDDQHGGARRDLQGGGQDRQVVRPRRDQHPGRQERRHHPREPAEQLRHLPLLPRNRCRQEERLQAGLAGHERLEGRRRAGGQDAGCHRLQRPRLRDRRR